MATYRVIVEQLVETRGICKQLPLSCPRHVFPLVRDLIFTVHATDLSCVGGFNRSPQLSYLLKYL